ncbi:ATP-binding protein [Streptomyces phaeolivaceus]|uniref:ATP-binding protein n=1 Tax=Streptomyces phaeolivaceus TaxID=2653200 RepID=A0A5P8K005_9ACTN|nr:AAA family ATPase [Streptomyces phaeolivaceus]QFQ95967.1 ATP-binding protein [Streptomyces phaeolivaceus]
MQHAVGAPLPPPHRPGQDPAAPWSPPVNQQGHPAPPHPGAPGPNPPGNPGAGHPPPPGTHPGPVPPPPPAPMAPPSPAGPPVPAPPPAPGFAGSPGHPHTSAPQQPGIPRDTTGHVQLPPGGPVTMPPPATGAPDVTTTTLAVLLIGPAGAGKTSVAKYWADHRRVPTAHISLDDVREWVRSGFADPQSGWNDNSEAQYRLARRTCGFSARNFLANGISCILDDAVFPDRPVVGLGGWKRHVGPGLLPVVLLPGLEIVLERNAERSGNRRLTDEEVARIHGRMAGWYGSGLPIIDNSQLDVPATARVLDEVLARSIASPPKW